MQTLLILTDFSEAALHASKYACMLAKQYHFNKIILYHNFQVIVPGTDIPVIIDENDETIYKQSMEQLDELRKSLSGLVNDSVTVEIMAETGPLSENINSISQKETAEIIVMGMRGKSNVERILFGSNTIHVVERCNFPVLIVPDKASISPIQTILFASDLKKVTETTHFDLLSRVLDIFPAKLHVLNVDYDNKHFSSGTPLEISHLNRMLDKYQPEYHFVTDKDVVSSILRFSHELKMSLIVTIPKKYGLFQQLFHRSITEKLIYHTDIPLLCLHE